MRSEYLICIPLSHRPNNLQVRTSTYADVVLYLECTSSVRSLCMNGVFCHVRIRRVSQSKLNRDSSLKTTRLQLPCVQYLCAAVLQTCTRSKEYTSLAYVHRCIFYEAYCTLFNFTPSVLLPKENVLVAE